MFGELPKLFDRNFIIAFFLPALFFVGSSFGLFATFNLFPGPLSYLRNDLLQGATVFGVVSWLGGVLLLALNYSIYRLLEGYGPLNPVRYLQRFEEARYKRLEAAQEKLDEEIAEEEADGESARLGELTDQANELSIKRFDEFPDRARLLPTAFGNALRAFEDYPTDIYGVDSIVVWVRLLAVIPEDYRGLIDTAKAQTDFWANLWLLAYLAVAEYFFVLVYSRQVKMLWFPVLMLVIAIVSSSKAKAAAIQWGDYAKAAFDLFLPELREKLQLPIPANIEEERKLWTRFSQVVIYNAKDQVIRQVPSHINDEPNRKSSKAAN